MLDASRIVVVVVAIVMHCTFCLAIDTRNFGCFEELQAIVVLGIDEEGCRSVESDHVLFG